MGAMWSLVKVFVKALCCSILHKLELCHSLLVKASMWGVTVIKRKRCLRKACLFLSVLLRERGDLILARFLSWKEHNWTWEKHDWTSFLDCSSKFRSKMTSKFWAAALTLSAKKPGGGWICLEIHWCNRVIPKSASVLHYCTSHFAYSSLGVKIQNNSVYCDKLVYLSKDLSGHFLRLLMAEKKVLPTLAVQSGPSSKVLFAFAV